MFVFLGLVLVLFLAPLAAFFMVGDDSPYRDDILLAVIGGSVVLFLLGFVFMVRKAFSMILNVILVLFGAIVLLAAVFARPLGIYEGEPTLIEKLIGIVTDEEKREEAKEKLDERREEIREQAVDKKEELQEKASERAAEKAVEKAQEIAEEEAEKLME